MSAEALSQLIPTLMERARGLSRVSFVGKPEEGTKDRLLIPILDALGYGASERTLEAAIPSLATPRTWVDFFLQSSSSGRPWLMIEAKPYSEKNLWSRHRAQVLAYLRDYAAMLGSEQPIIWLVLTNFREWHVVRLGAREPFWSFTAEDLGDATFVAAFYERFARENITRERLLEFYTERQREDLEQRTTEFLVDLKTWRRLVANGLRWGNPTLPLEQIREVSHILVLRLIMVRLLEAFGQEPFYSLGRLLELWKRAFHSTPFFQLLETKFRDTWLAYNTELFSRSAIDDLTLPDSILELLILPDAVPPPDIAGRLGGPFTGYRSIYNYDFTTLSHDVLGTAYEQFLAHHLVEQSGFIQVSDDYETRKREGIYYTPPHVVNHMVRRTLEPRVTPISAQALALLDQGLYEAAYSEIITLLQIRVLDAACGSGSFLISAFRYLLNAIDDYNTRATAARETMWAAPTASLISVGSQPIRVDDAHEKVLVNCIYGVDLDAQAVGLAKLSLWTELLRAHPGQYGRAGVTHAHLPALTLNIRTGNTLMAPPGEIAPYRAALREISELTRVAKDVDLPPERRRDVLDAVTEATSWIEVSRRSSLSDFFPDASAQPSLTWEAQFPDIFDDRIAIEQRGFDVVIGNPPYYSIDARFGRGAPELGWLSFAYPEVATDKTDILFYFIVQGSRLLRKDGDLCFIVSRSFLQGQKSEKLRTFLASETLLRYILDFLGNRVFRAGIATAIIQFTKKSSSVENAFVAFAVVDYDAVREDLAMTAVPSRGVVAIPVQQADLGADRWMISPYGNLFTKMRQGAIALRDVAPVGQGMQTGENEVFVLSREQINIERLPFPSEFLKPRASNENVFPFGITANDEYVLWVNDSEFEDLPTPVRAYLEKHRTALEARAACRRGDCTWYKFTWPLHADRHFLPKIISPYRAKRNTFVLDDAGTYLALTNTTNVFVGNSRVSPNALCALLNSTPVNFICRGIGGLAKLTGRGMFEYFENQIGDIPIPPIDAVRERRLSELGALSHQLFRQQLSAVQRLYTKSRSVPHTLQRFSSIVDLAGPYRSLVTWSSPNAQLSGQLFSLRVESANRGFALAGEITTDDDWQDGEREWVRLIEFDSENRSLLIALLAQALYSTEYDNTFRGRRRLTTGDGVRNIVRAALDVLQCPVYDWDPLRNLAIVETLMSAPEELQQSNDIDAILRRMTGATNEIDDICFQLYDMTDYDAQVRGALEMVL